MKEPIVPVQAKGRSQQRLVHSVLALDHYFHFPEMHFMRNTTGSRHHFWWIALHGAVSWKQGLQTPSCDRCNIPLTHAPHPKEACNMEKSAPKKHQREEAAQ